MDKPDPIHSVLKLLAERGRPLADLPAVLGHFAKDKPWVRLSVVGLCLLAKPFSFTVGAIVLIGALKLSEMA